MSKIVEYNHAPSEQSRSYDMLLPGMGARYHRFETAQPAPRLRTTPSQIPAKSVSARPLHVVDEPTERRDPPAHSAERQKNKSSMPAANFTIPHSVQPLSLRETQQKERAPHTFEQHTRSPIGPLLAASPDADAVGHNGDAIGNAPAEQATTLDNAFADVAQTNAIRNRPDQENKTAASAMLHRTTPSPPQRVRFFVDDDLAKRAQSFAAELENADSERSERQQRKAGVAAVQDNDADSISGPKKLTSWLSAKVPPEEKQRAASTGAQPAKKGASFASLSDAQRKAVVSVVQFLITTVAVFVLLLLLNPPFVQQQPLTTGSGLEASAMSSFSVQPTDLPKALVYSAIGGALAAALPYAWEFFVGIVPGASSRKKPPARRYRRRRREKSV